MAKEEAISFSPREMEVLALAWQCMESEPKINIDRLAQLTGYTPGSASVTLGKIKKKMRDHAKMSTPISTPRKASSGSVNKTPKSGTKRPAPAASEPAGKKKKNKEEAHKRLDQQYDDNDQEEEYRHIKVKNEETADLLRGAGEYLSHPQQNRHQHQHQHQHQHPHQYQGQNQTHQYADHGYDDNDYNDTKYVAPYAEDEYPRGYDHHDGRK
ncbi:hypothetical protein K504DRAFT_506469 [Pleomassaria siparia CBS 279.74]|uniref:Uncharacterized protein n=1 Tax=Pleomassaria siparia CBS 279.74 TaxID=1314801 RepID=A0A6G1JXR1_9PLEO|nr:hypothetical protein K504DRAFT_506469 [Pleomassaria siparia CBS 279.74]